MTEEFCEIINNFGNHPSSFCRCEHRELQLLLGNLPRRRLLRRGWGRWDLHRWRKLWNCHRRRRRWRQRRQLSRELRVQGPVQLVGRCQEDADCWLIRRPVANFPGEEAHIQPLRGLWWWDPVNKTVGIREWRKLAQLKGAVYTPAQPLCFLLGSSSANSSPEFTRKDYGNYCKWKGLSMFSLHNISPVLP